jgi:hypothetical protein
MVPRVFVRLALILRDSANPPTSVNFTPLPARVANNPSNVFTIVVRLDSHLFEGAVEIANPVKNASRLDTATDHFPDLVFFGHS